MKVRQATRGQPLVALFLLLVCWIGVRALSWDIAALAPGLPAGATVAERFAQSPFLAADDPVADADESGGVAAGLASERGLQDFAAPGLAAGWPALSPGTGGAAQPVPPRLRMAVPRFAPLAVGPAYRPGKVPVRLASAHQMLWLAMLQVPFPMGLALPLTERASAPFYPTGHEGARPGRWSADGWLLLRQGGNGTLATGATPATYGASQAGAVLRYRLAPESRHRLAAYLRTTAALNGSGEREVALGLAARPFPDIPVIAAAEMRATAQSGGTRLRPAAMLVTELAPFELPRKFRGEAYAQAGYVGGRFATPFADGQLRIDRGVATIGQAELRAGAGAWGGAQKGASRLDLGPAAAVGLGLGRSASARVAVDWRFRVAGDAEPASGPALTLSAGF